MRHLSKRFFVSLAALLVFMTLGAAAAFAGTPMYDFDYARYGSDYPDVLRAYGQEVYRLNLYQHYLRSGAAEGRVAYSISTGQPFVLDAGESQAYDRQLKLKTTSERLATATLTPDRNWPAPLLEAAENVINNVGGTTPAEKLHGCYDWLIANCSYGYTSGSLNEGSELAQQAYQMFEQNVGVCDDYSSAFVVMARILGYDARLQSGKTHMASGGYTGHTWAVINIHGVDYVFDPQVEDNIAKGGAVRYLRYCKSYNEVSNKYLLYCDDYISDSVMASTSTDPLPAYTFGQAGSLLESVNASRASAGLAPLTWDTELARAAYRVCNGVPAEEAGKGLTYSSFSYGYIMLVSEDMLVSSRYTRVGMYQQGVTTAFYLA